MRAAGGLGAAARDAAHAVARGFREGRTILLLAWANACVAGLAVLPVMPAVQAAYGHAPRSVGRPLLSVDVLLGLAGALRDGPRPSVLGPLLLLVVFSFLLAGGVTSRAVSDGPFRAGPFAVDAVRLLGRNVRLWLWCVPVLLAALVPVAVAGAVLSGPLHRPLLLGLSEDWVFGRVVTIPAVAHLALAVFCLSAWRLVVESARVLVLRDDLRSMRRAVWRAVVLVVRSPASIAVAAVLAGVATLAVFTVARTHASLPEGTSARALLALLVGEVAVLVRLGFQVSGAVYAAEVVRRRAPAPRHAANDVPHPDSPIASLPLASPDGR